MQKLRFPLRLAPGFDHHLDMVSLEQASNLNLLLGQVLHTGVPGAIVELGCYTGSTTCIIGHTLAASGEGRPFHVFDRFDVTLGEHPAGRDVFERNLKAAGAPMPVIHQGDVLEVVPASLPSRIAFAHLDLGVGGDTELHARLMDHVLRHVYERLSPGAILVLMDYYVPGLTVEGHDSNPGVRKAADLFFRDKPETVTTLFGGPCSHGYVRKAG
jgi:O-methyltransferase